MIRHIAAFFLLLSIGLWCLQQVPSRAAGWLPLATAAAGCSQATTFLARTSGLDGAHTTAYTTLICALVSAGNPWTQADAIYVVCTTDSTTAGLNLKSTSFTLTANGAPTFTADAGYTGGTNQYLDTALNANSGGVSYTQNSNGVFFWTLTNLGSGTDYGAAFGFSTVTSNAVQLYPHFSDNNFYYRPQTSTQSSTPFTAGTHFFGTTRSATSVDAGWQTTTAVTPATTSVGFANDNFAWMKNLGDGTSFWQANFAMGWIGGDLSNATDETNLYNAFHVYGQSICGAP